MEQRRFHRVKINIPSEFKHHDMNYRCRLENISLRGALISADECIMVPLGETGIFSIYLESEHPPLVISATVVHCFFSMVGVKFVAFAEDAENRLFELLKRNTQEPVKLMHEWEALQTRKETLQQEQENMSRSSAAPS